MQEPTFQLSSPGEPLLWLALSGLTIGGDSSDKSGKAEEGCCNKSDKGAQVVDCSTRNCTRARVEPGLGTC